MARDSLKGLDSFQLSIEYIESLFEYEIYIIYSIHVTYFFLQQALVQPTLIFETGQSCKLEELPRAGKLKHASFSYRKLKALCASVPTSNITRTMYNDRHDIFQILKISIPESRPLAFPLLLTVPYLCKGMSEMILYGTSMYK